MLKKASIIILSLFLGLSGTAHALNTQLHKTYFPGHKGSTIIQSTPKAKDVMTFGLGLNYAMQPFEYGNSNGNIRVRGVVDHLFTIDFVNSYSITDKVAVGLNIPLHITNNVQSLSNLTQETVFSFGDVMFSGLFTLIHPDDSTVGVGLAIAPFISVPSGAAGNFIGENSFTGGAFLVGDVNLNDHYLGLNIGFRFREEENYLNLTVGQQMIYKLAYQHYISESFGLDGFVEWQGSITLNQVTQNSSPMEIKVGLSKKFTEEFPLEVKFTNGIGVSNGYGTPDYRAAVLISYDHLFPVKEKEDPAPRILQKIEKRLKELTIYYPTDGAQVDPFYDEKIAGIADILKEYPEYAPLYIVGHTDEVGAAGYNIRLSERRAKQAYESILKLGISPEKVKWYGVGESYPRVANDSKANRARNRRTLFTFSKPSYLNGKITAVEYSEATTLHNDSYTEVLKKKARNQQLQEGDYYKEETVIKKVEVDDSNGSKSKRKKKAKKNKNRRDNMEEDLIITDETLDENFAE